MKKTDHCFVNYLLRRFDSFILACSVSFLCHPSLLGAAAGSASKDDGTAIRLPETGEATTNKQKTAEVKSPRKKVTVVFEGEIDGEGTFTFRDNKIIYKHGQLKKPKNVTVNNKKWENLDKPFELGFIPDFPSTKIVERSGRNPIRVIPSREDVEVYFFDTDDSSSKYRVALQFNVSATASKETTESKPVASDKTKTTKAVGIETDDGPIRNEDKLPGVFYDLRRSSKGLDYASKKGVKPISLERWQEIIKTFVDGHWMNSTDYSNNIPYFQYFSNYYCYHNNRYDSSFNWSMSDSAIKSFFPDENASAEGFVGLHAGYIKAPFSGKIRFVGSGADVFAVHFDGKLAFEYILGVTSNSAGRVTVSRASSIAKNNVFSVVKGNVYPIKIMYSSIRSNGVSVSLSVQRLDSNGESLGQSMLFRTTSESSSTTTSASNTRTKNASQTTTVNNSSSDSQIWKVTDSRGYRIKPRKKESVEKLKFQ